MNVTVCFRITTVIFLYLIVILISSFNLKTTLFTNIIYMIYYLQQWFRNKLNKYKPLLILFSISNYLIFQIMVASYAEILEWENILLVLFYLIAFYYHYKSINISNFK